MKKWAFLFSFLFVLTFSFTACNDDEPDTGEMETLTIIPGQGINNLKIGDPGSQVMVELGDGFETIINVGGSGNANYNYFHLTKGIDIIFGQYDSGEYDIDTLPIQSFSLFEGFKGMTAEGIQLGSSRADVIAAYGNPDQEQFGANVYNIGLVISYNSDDKVRDIVVIEI